MNKEITKLASNIIINEVRPRAKKHGGNLPPPKLLASLARLKYENKITSGQVKQVLDKYYENI